MASVSVTLRGTIGVPCREMLHTEFWMAWMGLEKRDIATAVQVGWSVADQRNDIVKMFQGDWLLFIDSDMCFASDALARLLVRGNKDIIGAVCLQRNQPFAPCVWDLEGHRMTPAAAVEKGEPFECESLGMGFTLIRRRVFDKMPFPWFEVGKGKNPAALAEDLYFCRKARGLGFKVWADPTIPVWHLGHGSVALGKHGIMAHVGLSPLLKGMS